MSIITGAEEQFGQDVVAWFRREEGQMKSPVSGRHIVYPCPAGFKTIGYGHKLTHGEKKEGLLNAVDADGNRIKFNDGISDYEAGIVLMDDLLFAERAVQRRCPEAKGAGTFRELALSAMVFQMGEAGVFGNEAAGIRGFKDMVAAVKRGDWPEVGEQARNSVWAKDKKRGSPARALRTAWMLEHNRPTEEQCKYWLSIQQGV